MSLDNYIHNLEGLKKYYDLWIEKVLQIYNIDNIMNGYSLLYVYRIATAFN